jgi:hypothetical protein
MSSHLIRRRKHFHYTQTHIHEKKHNEPCIILYVHYIYAYNAMHVQISNKSERKKIILIIIITHILIMHLCMYAAAGDTFEQERIL